ncbi:MAG TPA: hypothetical protein VKE69_04145, partial [Planctomycetota bacterium]|nr:hypothetical protein [Planctomycetota bacterium]
MKQLAPLAFVLAAVPAAFAQTKGTPQPWGLATDLPVDSRIHFGKLENGFRYAWLSNHEPKERTYVRLHV